MEKVGLLSILAIVVIVSNPFITPCVVIASIVGILLLNAMVLQQMRMTTHEEEDEGEILSNVECPWVDENWDTTCNLFSPIVDNQLIEKNVDSVTVFISLVDEKDKNSVLVPIGEVEGNPTISFSF